MSGESSKRSNLIDITYQHLHSILSGQLEGTTPNQVVQIVIPRLEQLRTVSAPFGKPSDASRKKIDGGSITLPDGVILHIDETDKEYVLAISNAFNIDQVHSLVLMRSFFYNEGLPSSAGSNSATSLVDELLEAITPFYFSERLSIIRVLIPLFRANENTADPLHEVADAILPKLLPDGHAFAESLITEYVRKTQEGLPEGINNDPRKASRWVKQNNREQLVLLEALFWTMWGYVPCDGPLVVRIFEVAYETNLGSVQKHSTLLLNEEGAQLQQDCAALWILITVEILELERVAEPGGIEISANPAQKDIYYASPDSLKRIHDMVISNGSSQHACTYLAWAFVLSRFVLATTELKSLPDSYRPFFDSLLPHLHLSYSKDREPTHAIMSRLCLEPEVGLFKLILMLLTNSPLFVTAIAWKTGSTVTDPNAIAFRSVLKGLVVALVELVPVENIPDFDSFVEVWIALFGRSESQSIAGICKQFWQSDWTQNFARRAILDVARSRFPIQLRPLLKLLRAMTAAGFLDTDTLSTADHSHEGEELDQDRDLCERHVFYYLDKLPTYSQIIRTSACTGPHALYEKAPERYGASIPSPGITYTNLKPIKLPGGTILPARSSGRLLTGDGGDFIVVGWNHQHSGWKVILEVLTDYINRKCMHASNRGSYPDVSFHRRGEAQPIACRLEDIGVEMDSGGDEAVVTDAFDLLRGVIQDNALLAEELLETLEAGEPVVAHTMTESQPPGLVQLTTTILEEALSRHTRQTKSPPATQLITSAMSVLSALLALPQYSNRVWLYIRSTTVLFGSDRTIGCTSALSSERVTGHYTMTLALLHLVQRLFHEASSSMLTVLPDNPRLQQVKEEVLLRAARFVHSEIWVEHLGWKYAQLGDKFEIGRRVTSLYAEIMKHSPLTLKERPFPTLSQTIADVLLHKASSSTINPLVSSVATGGSFLSMLYTSRRYGDARRLIFLLESHLRLIRLILAYKQNSTSSSKPCLLEQALCAPVTGSTNSLDSSSKIDPVDVLASYVKGRDVGSVVPLEAVRVLYALCSSLSSSQPSPTTLIGHLSDPEATVTSMVRIVQHPYDELSLRNAVWSFMSLAVDKQPALASLFATGQFRSPIQTSCKGKEEPVPNPTGGTQSKPTSALDVALDIIANGKDLWEVNAQLLASVLRFLDVVWQHALEHKSALEAIRKDANFWDQIATMACAELGPIPDYQTEVCIHIDGIRRSNLHEAVSSHAYRTISKSYALHIIGLDIDIHLQIQASSQPPSKPLSYLKVEKQFKSEEQLTDLVSEASPSSYDPELHDELTQHIRAEFPALTLEELRLQGFPAEREFGDDFTFSTSLLHSRLEFFHASDDAKADHAEEVDRQLRSVNLNLSLTHSQIALAESWQFLLRQITPYLRGDSAVRPIVMGIASSVSFDIAAEKRPGDMMATIHGTRLALLLGLVEVAWFSTADNAKEIQAFVELVNNVHGIILNEAQSPAKSFLGSLTVPFHRSLLQIIYFCSKHCRNLARRQKTLNAEQRLNIASMHEATLTMVIDALRVVFDSARSRVDVELDRDMELLIAVFEQCTRPEVSPSSSLWLARCQETDVIRASLDLFVRTDLVGLSDIPLLLSRRRPLYSPYILLFHMALTSIPSAAERLASEGGLAAYSNNSISPALSAGLVDVVLPELPGERSPAHRAYCSMLAVVTGVVAALGRHNHYFDAEASGFVQLYGGQISRALSWTISDPLTFPLLEEMEQTTNLFYAIAESTPSSTANINPAVEEVLRVFTTHALLLLQQLNYALTHPNHLASVLEAVTNEERAKIDKDTSTPSSDPLKRPLIARLVYRLFRLSSVILSTLISVSRADSVLIGQEEDWPFHHALIIPHSKVVLGEPASLGTLIELGNCTLDVLRDLAGRPAGQAIAPTSVSETPEMPLDVKEGIWTARHNLEAVLVYATTQLVMGLSKAEVDPMGGEMETDDQHSESQRVETIKERKSRRPSQTLTERLRRGVTGEMAVDLLSLLNKAKPVIAKTKSSLGPADVDLTQVLSNFLHERIRTPS